jgi:hypothetical protein
VDAGARGKGFLEEGESVEEVAVVGQGQIGFAIDNPGAFARRYVLAATERNLYVMSLGQIGFKSVKDVVTKMPIGEAELERSIGEVKVSRRGEEGAAQFKTPPLASPRRLLRYVEAHQV